ncbi:sugar ABC transporter permease [Isoptericola sp. b490]|uniref:carbohydrate ABC transporter permease n=1 Tax=Actinotalea lenta TaxID=3064654 RepID=UPI00271283E4|nr:sugar ABC transporter permease [Isoptericola sp. b490]MDO8119820.1 sugar ABC transporter permease [Isoptericola sp. b490]
MSARSRSPRTRSPEDLPRMPEPGKSSRGYWLYFIPGILLTLLVVVYPIVYNVGLSFASWRGGFTTPTFVGLDNWVALAHDAAFWMSFRNIIYMIVAMVIIPTLVGLVLAAVLFDVIGRRFSGRLASFLRATFYLPQVIPIAVAGVLFGWVLYPDSSGVLNQFLSTLTGHAVAVNWVGGTGATALFSVMLLMVWIQIGYPVVIFMAALQRVDPELYEAAELDGAGWFRRFGAITRPMIRPEVFVVTLTTTIAALKVFAPVFIMTQGGPNKATYVPSYYAYIEFFGNATNKGYAATIATSVTIVVSVVALLFLRAQRRAEQREA